jgi:hypothetical protein
VEAALSTDVIRLFERKQIARSLLERDVEPLDLEPQPSFGALSAGAAYTADLELPFASGLEPRPEPVDPAPAADAPLPQADVLLITWTIPEVRALADVLTPGHARGIWHRYGRGFEDRYAARIRPGAPALRAHRLGSWLRTRVGDTTAVCFKSELHLNQDGIMTGPGTATLPLKELLQQLIVEVRPRVVLSLGTSGAVSSDQELGDVVVTRAAKFHCRAEFEAEPWNGRAFRSDWEIPSERFGEAEQLMRRHATELIEPAFGPPTKRFQPATPLLMSEAANAPRIHLDGRDMPAFRPVLTTDFLEFGTTANGLHREGCAVEMSDAVLGLACAELPDPPRWASVRNISQPQINADLQTDPPRLDMQIHWTVWYERAFGYWTSVSSALAAWAIVAALDDQG